MLLFLYNLYFCKSSSESHFLFLILVILVFFPLSHWKKPFYLNVLLCCYFQRASFWFYWFSLLFYYSSFHWIPALIFGILPLFALGSVRSSCSVSYGGRSGCCLNISSLQVHVYSSKYPLGCIACKCLCVLCIHFHSTQLRTGQIISLLISLTNWLFRSMLLHFYIFVNSPSFFQLISNSVVLWNYPLYSFCLF